MGMAIYDAFKDSPSHVSIICSGLVASMGSFILQAADTRILMPNCDLMIHEGGMSVNDTNKGVITATNWLKYKWAQHLGVYVERCLATGRYFIDNKLSKPAVKQFIQRKIDKQQEWYLTAKEAVDYGFADQIKETN